MTTEQAAELIKKYNENLASPEEIKLVESWFIVESAKTQADPESLDYQEVKNRVWSKVAKETQKTKNVVLWPRFVAAASLLLFLSVGAYFLLKPKPVQQTVQNTVHQIVPGSNKATLTLANGKTIILTGAKNGTLAMESQTAINKTADGQVAYNNQNTADISAATYNTMTTPRGGQYTLTLADGTKVFLNAASSITYPVAFNGKERRVKLSGEAYFEVAHNKAMPFHVEAKGQDVEVLGTHFNINSYEDEAAVKTTLLEGSVKLHTDKTVDLILKPGEQATFSKNKLTHKEVDTELAIAWKNGDFIFQEQDLQTTMRQIARWYDVKVVYDDPTIHAKIYADISRYKDISVVLSAIEQTGKVKFIIKGKEIRVIR